MNKFIEKIQKDCLEVHKEDENYYSLVVSKDKLNKVANYLKDCGVELHFNYGYEIIIEVLF